MAGGLIVLVCTLVLWPIAGNSLDFYLVSAITAALLGPSFIARETVAEDLLTIGALTVGVIAPWFTADACSSSVTAGEVVRCGAIVAAVLCAETGLVRLLVGCGVDATIGRAAIMILGGAWLTWPLWLSAAPSVLVQLHPLLNVNAAVSARLGIWTEQPIAYSLISLGQDVPYRLPPSPWPCVGFHAVLGLAACFLGTVLSRRSRGFPTAAGPFTV